LKSGRATVLAINTHRARALAAPAAFVKAKFDEIPIRAEHLRPETNPSLIWLDLPHLAVFEVAQASFLRPFAERVEILLEGVDLFLRQ
jgi:hypothetical protein